MKNTPLFLKFDKSETQQSIPARFEKQVFNYPDKLAVKTRKDKLTYSELNYLANYIGRAILAQCEENNEPIALLLNQGTTIIATIIGVLKAGQFYLPLDPGYPKARLIRMIEDAQPRLIITDNYNLSLANELALARGSIVNLDTIEPHFLSQNLNLSLTPNHLAYIFYTSGSTGRPKGVVDTHQNVLHNIMRYTNNLQICADDKLSLLQSCSFSGSVSSLFCALLNGATVFPYDVLEEGLDNLADWIVKEEITIYHSVPSIFRHLAVEGKQFSKLRYIRLEGDRASIGDVQLYKKFFPSSCTLVNGLGGTECGIVRQYFIGKEIPITDSIVPIGYAVEDMEILLLDDAAQKVDIGCIGEIAVKSQYLVPGYWKRADLTLAAFLNDPAEQDKRIYRTGDLGRMRTDGCLEYLGRKDFRVKIRGYSIEVAEIEIALLSLTKLKDAVVVACDDSWDEKSLVAYLVVNREESAPTIIELQGFLRQQLPDYMVPPAFMFLDALPLTSNGKVDRNALPTPDFFRLKLSEVPIAPRTSVERQIAEIWLQLLKLEQIGVHDNFFALGGQSLLATQVLSRLRQAFQVEIPLNNLFELPTIAELAQRIEIMVWATQKRNSFVNDDASDRMEIEL